MDDVRSAAPPSLSPAARSLRDQPLPLIAAPMFLVSGPALVTACCNNGVVGTFPALNQRSTAEYEAWLAEIEAGTRGGAPYGVNLIVHRTNPRLDADLAVTVARKVPVVITSLGAVSEVVAAVHSYGGVVLQDVTTVRHGEKALQAGVDGLIAVSAGAGGHAGAINPFALVSDLRRLSADMLLVLAGALNTGGQVVAALAAGADLAYMGTRFIATRESLASEAYKNMLLASGAGDIVYTPKISGINANFLKPSIVANGLDLDLLGDHGAVNLGEELSHKALAWKHVWSAGHGVGGISDLPSAAELCLRLSAEYNTAIDRLSRRRVAV